MKDARAREVIDHLALMIGMGTNYKQCYGSVNIKSWANNPATKERHEELKCKVDALYDHLGLEYSDEVRVGVVTKKKGK